jgi:hypothetical protein
LAKNLCPFRPADCGQKQTFEFTTWGKQMAISVELPPGETCTYQINADCGIPTYKINNSAGFEIESFDYTDSDISSSSGNRRFLSGEDDDIDTIRYLEEQEDWFLNNYVPLELLSDFSDSD